MTRARGQFVKLVVASLLMGDAFAFSNPNTPLPMRSLTSIAPSSSTTCLHLLPEQGSQLAAAWTAACSEKKDDDDDDFNNEHHHHETQTAASASSPSATILQQPTCSKRQQAASAARAFVSAVFSLPSSLLHPHKSEKEYTSVLAPLASESSPERKDGGGDDVVLYPIVGFRMVMTEDGTDGDFLSSSSSTATDHHAHMTVRALPTTSHAACRIPRREQQEEVLAGWFSPACRIPMDAPTTVKNIHEITTTTTLPKGEDDDDEPKSSSSLAP